jgi:hypothetical protein
VLHCPIQPSHSRLPYLVHRSASHDLSRNPVDQATKCTHHSAPPHVTQQCARLLRGRPWPLVLLSLYVCDSISGSYMALPVLRHPIWVWWSVALRYRYPVVGLAYRDDRCTASTGSVTCRAGRRWAELVSENQWNSTLECFRVDFERATSLVVHIQLVVFIIVHASPSSTPRNPRPGCRYCR